MDRLTIANALKALDNHDETYLDLFEHGTLSVGMYQLLGTDPQTPHTRDEVYVIVRGSGYFVNGDERRPFEPGEVLFVPAGVVHRFEDFTDDFAAWVFFYGPEGGEGD